MQVITLVPLSSDYHVDPLQQVYRSVPRFWNMYGVADAPDGQALRDLQEAEATPDRTMLGILRRIHEDEPAAGHELVGIVDVRVGWPAENTAYLGMVMVAESLQRQGIGTQAWRMLAEWLAGSAGIDRVRLGVEQFNPIGLHFFSKLGFKLTGNAGRIRVGEKWIRLLYMERRLTPMRQQHSISQTEPESGNSQSDGEERTSPRKEN